MHKKQVVVIHEGEPVEAFYKYSIASFSWYRERPGWDVLEKADLIVDWTVEDDHSRIDFYRETTRPVLLGEVVHTLEELGVTHLPIGRMNHWPTFVERPITELSLPRSHRTKMTDLMDEVLLAFHDAPDVPGFLSSRIAMTVINEAYRTLGERVASAQTIDLAMRQAANYPIGPFDWFEKIGPKRVLALLEKLAQTRERYTPAKELIKRVNNAAAAKR
ncbi:MAG TPA: 3-hydroxyacyl-CoA dehydrogenase family protein [Lacibacter sp.]|nr:3-hydroxyacyl-CoA dehydrogenase family protein [Lacibacter sp.]HMO88121.1 3-hydroxyacyl-CoA dehydrogenase family protein [Lacibacter sp.]HMP86335.1 3-hydroxyacyl-CoA dehydrogenase family protein [Lacibacter sp.]